MPRRARQLSNSEIYHVMARGVNRDAIFLEDEDFERFLHAVAMTKAASGCRILAYCLMTNHVHLVLRTSREPIGAVMKRLGVRYAGWFNHKYGRVGHLFQDRFKSLPVETDEYLVVLLRYVWNNPVEAGLVTHPEEYRWSSRRLLGLSSQLIDADELEQLLPVSLSELVAAPVVQPTDTPRERPPRRTLNQVNQLLERICGASDSNDFCRQPTDARQRAIRELRTRGVPYRQIAAVTGMSISSVRRMHLADSPTHALR